MLLNKSAANYQTCISNNKLMARFHLWRRCLNAATAIEYALIAAGIATAIAVVVFTLGTDLLTNAYQKLHDLLVAHM